MRRRCAARSARNAQRVTAVTARRAPDRAAGVRIAPPARCGAASGRFERARGFPGYNFLVRDHRLQHRRQAPQPRLPHPDGGQGGGEPVRRVPRLRRGRDPRDAPRSYAEDASKGRDDHAIQELMEQQHRTMIAAIQRGRFDGPNGGVQIPDGMRDAGRDAEPARRIRRRDAGRPRRRPEPRRQIAGDRTLDQVILDYLASETTPEELDVALVADAGASSRAVRRRSKLKAVLGLAGAARRGRVGPGPDPLDVGQAGGRLPGQDRRPTAPAPSPSPCPRLRDGNAAAVVRVCLQRRRRSSSIPVKKQVSARGLRPRQRRRDAAAGGRVRRRPARAAGRVARRAWPSSATARSCRRPSTPATRARRGRRVRDRRAGRRRIAALVRLPPPSDRLSSASRVGR